MKNQRSPQKKVNDDGTILNKVYILRRQFHILLALQGRLCLLYTSDAADES